MYASSSSCVDKLRRREEKKLVRMLIGSRLRSFLSFVLADCCLHLQFCRLNIPGAAGRECPAAAREGRTWGGKHAHADISALPQTPRRLLVCPR